MRLVLVCSHNAPDGKAFLAHNLSLRSPSLVPEQWGGYTEVISLNTCPYNCNVQSAVVFLQI